MPQPQKRNSWLIVSTFYIGDGLPPGEAGDEEGAAECSKQCSDGDAAVEDSLSGSLGNIDIEDILEGFSFDLSEVDDAVTEVEGR